MAESNVKRGYVYHGSPVAATEVGKYLKDWFKDEASIYFAAFRPDGCQLAYFDLADAQELVAEWDEGRVFSARLEVRWHKLERGYETWLLAEEGNLPKNLDGLSPVEAGPGGWQATKRIHQQDGVYIQGIYLWGQYNHQEKAWIEVRLPQKMKYPAPPPSKEETDTGKLFARIGHIDYRAFNNAVQFVRLTEVK